MQDLSNEAVKRIRDLGAVAYLRGYIRLMVRELDIDESDTEGMDHMLLQMVEPLNVATEAIWRALMSDKSEEMEKVLARFKESLEPLQTPITEEELKGFETGREP